MLKKQDCFSKQSFFIFSFLFLSWIMLNIFFGEHIPVDSGNGWDGSRYADIIQNFHHFVFQHNLDQYTLQRILPEGIIYFFFNIFHLPIERSQIPMAFSIYNYILFIFSIIICCKIIKLSNWSTKTGLIALTGIFLNFSQLKLMSYYPTLTDTTSLFLSIATLYCFLIKREYLILLIGVIASFVSPTQFYINALLFLFSVNRKKTITHINFNLLSVFCAACATAVVLAIYFHYGFRVLGGNYKTPILALSIISIFSYLCYSFIPLIQSSLENVTRLNVARLLLTILIFFIVKDIIYMISNRATNLSFFDFFRYLSAEALAYPLNFLISHILYFGPILLLAGLFWRELCQNPFVKNSALGYVILFCILLSLDSESRQLINFLPFMVFITADTLNKKHFSWPFVISFITLSILISKAWLPLNHGTWLSLLTNPPEITLDFPLQWFFMNLGPWVSHPMYIINLSIVAILFFILRKNIKYQVS